MLRHPLVEEAERGASTGNAAGSGGFLRPLLCRAIALLFDLAAYVSVRASAGRVARRARGAAHARSVRVIAHRGASAYAPENTLAAFRRAVELGAREIELDVQQSRDGKMIVFHDTDLAPKTNAEGCVRDHDAEDLRKLDIGSWFDATDPDRGERFEGTRLATLDEVFEAFSKGLHYHVEIKAEDASLPARILAIVERFGVGAQVTITSFHIRALLQVRELDPQIPICELVRGPKRLRERAMDRTPWQDLRAMTLVCAEIERAATNGFDQVALPANCLNRRIVAFARDRGLGIRAWRVRTEADLDRVVVAGADGVTVNWPDRAIAHLEERAGV